MKLIIYTAIFGHYDTELPNLQIFNNIDYKAICYTDSDIVNVDNKWKIIKAPRYFHDNKLNSLFFKCLAHILFPNNELTIWIDGNLHDVRIFRHLIDRILYNSPVATPKHVQRNSIFEEASFCSSVNLDNPLKIEKHCLQLSTYNLHMTGDLSATMFLFRDLSDWRVRAMNTTWWNMIINGSRRDQLSFDAALKFHGLASTSLGVKWWTNNTIFSQKKHSHERKIAENKKEFYFSTLNTKGLPPNYPNTKYQEENWDSTTLTIINELNSEVISSGEKMEGNYCYMHKSDLHENLPPDPRRSYKREFLRRSTTGSKNILEIGFNAGHSAALILSCSKSSILTAIDIGEHSYALPCAKILKKHYPERFNIIWGKSVDVLNSAEFKNNNTSFDLVHIDGGHGTEAFLTDINWFIRETKNGTFLLVDDAYVKHIRHRLALLIKEGILSEVIPNLVSSGENRLLVKI
ncbi:MAG: class I SAM-dependent methyltransferase [Planctomycetota bacterium]